MRDQSPRTLLARHYLFAQRVLAAPSHHLGIEQPSAKDHRIKDEPRASHQPLQERDFESP